MRNTNVTLAYAYLLGSMVLTDDPYASREIAMAQAKRSAGHKQRAHAADAPKETKSNTNAGLQKAGKPSPAKRVLSFVGAVFLAACAAYTALTMVIMGNGIAIGIVGTIVFAAVAVRLARIGLGEDMGTLRRRR